MILVLSAIVLVAGVVAYHRLAQRLLQVEMRLRTAELRLERREAPAAEAAVPAAAPAPAAPPEPGAVAAAEPAMAEAPEAAAAPEAEPILAPADTAPEKPPPAEPAAPAPAAPPAAPPPPRPAVAARSLEETLGTRWMVWLGGLALALGGIFLVRYSIERGWLGPGVRTILGFVLAGLLIGAGELVRRRELKAMVPGVPAADIPAMVTAAGIVTGFASAYVAYAVYGFLGPAAAFLLLGAFSFSAFAAAVLHGPILAAFGIAGSYLTPFLTATEEPNAAAFFSYLAAVTAAAFALARVRGWLWLVWTATAGGVGWGLLWFDSAWQPDDTLVLTVYILALGALALALLRSDAGEAPPVEGALTRAALVAAYDGVALAVLAAATALVLPIVLLRDHDAAAMLSLTAVAGFLVAAAWLWPRLVPLAAWAGLLFLLSYVSWKVRLPEGPWALRDEIAANRLGPQDLADFLRIGALAGLVFAGIGFAGSLRRPGTGIWAGLAAGVPIVIFVYAYLRATEFAVSLPFGAAAAAMAGGYAAMAEAAHRRLEPAPRALAEALFAGAATASLALAASIVLEKGWLTIALALMAAALAWVNAARPLVAFRLLAGLLALIVTVRLWASPGIVAEPGTTVIFNWLLPGHGIPAAALFLAATLFRRSDPGCRVVPLLEGAGSAAAVLLVGTEIRHAMNAGRVDATDAGLAELSLHSLAWLGFALGFHWLAARRGGASTFRWAAIVTGCLGALALGFGHLLFENPLFTGDPVGEGRVFNLLLLGYALPALLLGALYWRLRGTNREPYETASGAGALLLAFSYLTLMVRKAFQGPVLSFHRLTDDAEWYAYSAAWLLFGVLLLAAGLRFGSGALRRASLAVILVAIVKVFAFDMAALTGLYRAVSFLGLGAALIGIGFFYQKVVFPAAKVEGSSRPPAG